MYLAGELTPLGNQHVRPIFELVLEFLERLDPATIGAGQYAHVSCLVEVLGKLAEEDIRNRTTQFRFKLAGELLDLNTFNGRMSALREIDALCNDTQHYYRRRLEEKDVVAWIRDNDVLRRALAGNLHHQQYVDRLQVTRHIFCRAMLPCGFVLCVCVFCLLCVCVFVCVCVCVVHVV